VKGLFFIKGFKYQNYPLKASVFSLIFSLSTGGDEPLPQINLEKEQRKNIR